MSCYHTGAFLKKEQLEAVYQREYYQNSAIEQRFKSTLLPSGLEAKAYRQAMRACKGMPLRQEVYSMDTDNPKHTVPYSATQSGYKVELVQAALHQDGYASFMVVPIQSISYGYERNPNDPRISQNLVLETNELGMPTHTAQVIYPRLSPNTGLPWMVQREQAQLHVITKQVDLTNDVSTADSYRLRTVWQEQAFEVLGLT